MTDALKQVLGKIRTFRDERDWQQFHGHKEMAVSITIEAAELLEHFQWKTSEEVDVYVKQHKHEIADEIADVAMYLFELADNLEIDLLEAVAEKIKKNAIKYPVHKAKGNAKKYTHL